MKHLFKVTITQSTTVLLDDDDPGYAGERAAPYLSDISSADWEIKKIKELEDDDSEVKDYE